MTTPSGLRPTLNACGNRGSSTKWIRHPTGSSGVDGVLDAVASYDLRSLLTTLFATGHQHLQLDLSQVTYADQDGIGGLA